MQRVERTVNPTFSDVRIAKRFYRVNPELRGDRVQVRWDPYGDLQTVHLYTPGPEHQYLGRGERHNREKGMDMPATPAQGIPKYNYLELLLEEHEAQLKQPAHTGIDYRKALARRAFSFPAFIRKYAHLLGRRGGMSAFSTEEIEALKRIYNRHPDLDVHMLVGAFTHAREKTIAHLGYELQVLAHKRRNPDSPKEGTS
jgi:hypothetical protein